MSSASSSTFMWGTFPWWTSLSGICLRRRIPLRSLPWSCAQSLDWVVSSSPPSLTASGGSWAGIRRHTPSGIYALILSPSGGIWRMICGPLGIAEYFLWLCCSGLLGIDFLRGTAFPLLPRGVQLLWLLEAVMQHLCFLAPGSPSVFHNLKPTCLLNFRSNSSGCGSPYRMWVRIKGCDPIFQGLELRIWLSLILLSHVILLVRTPCQLWRLPFVTLAMPTSGALCLKPSRMQRWRRKSETKTGTQGTA